MVFFYIPMEAVFTVIEETGAIADDISGGELSHVDKLYRFDTFLQKY